jgi:hypothetical protein
VAEHDLAAAVSAATDQLAAAGVASPRVDAEELAAALLGMSRGRVQAAMIRGAAVPDGYHDLVARRAQREPLQHLTGVTGFRHVDISCAAGVFVARPETELVAGAAIEAARRSPHPLVVDLCTGSGAIAAAVLDEVPTARVVAVDLHAAACALAETNLRRVAPADRFTVVHADATAEATLADLDGTVDVCVSNPAMTRPPRFSAAPPGANCRWQSPGERPGCCAPPGCSSWSTMTTVNPPSSPRCRRPAGSRCEATVTSPSGTASSPRSAARGCEAGRADTGRSQKSEPHARIRAQNDILAADATSRG